MNERICRIDARGLACPEPVIQTKKALEQGGFEELEVVVDNPAARDNVSRFVVYAGAGLLQVHEEGGLFRIRIAPGAGSTRKGLEDGAFEACDEAPQAAPSVPPLAGMTVLISSAELGRGEPSLGALLMKGFLYSLAEAETPPKRLIFMNAGVRLCCEASESLPNLKRLAQAGVEILACGTCLDFYKLKESLALGRISNMYEISSCLLEGRSLSI